MIKVTQEVFDGLEAVRESGRVNMFNVNMVRDLCWLDGHEEAGQWVEDNPKSYARLIIQGPEIADVSQTDADLEKG